jgi:hypothetical protein
VQPEGCQLGRSISGVTRHQSVDLNEHLRAVLCAELDVLGLGHHARCRLRLGRRDRGHEHGNVGVGKGRLDGQVVRCAVRIERDQGGIVDEHIRCIGERAIASIALDTAELGRERARTGVDVVAHAPEVRFERSGDGRITVSDENCAHGTLLSELPVPARDEPP